MQGAQITIGILLVISLLTDIYKSIYGVSRVPTGFGGVVASIIAFVFMCWLQYTAGSLSLLFK